MVRQHSKPPVPEILRGRLDGNNRDQVLALRAYERQLRDWEEEVSSMRSFEDEVSSMRSFIVEVPISGSRYYEVEASSPEEAKVMIADGNGHLLHDELEELRDFCQVERQSA